MAPVEAAVQTAAEVRAGIETDVGDRRTVETPEVLAEAPADVAAADAPAAAEAAPTADAPEHAEES